MTILHDTLPPLVTMTVPAQAPLRSTLSWSGLDGLAGVRGYEVQVSLNGGLSWTPLVSAASVTHTVFVGSPGQTYHFRVKATDKVNNESGWVQAGPMAIVAVTKYYALGGQRVAMRQGEEVYFLHGDHLGSTSLTTDGAGNVVSEVRYHPYGEERWRNGEAVTDFGFTGQRNEAGFGLMDYKARYYSPVLGRFVSPDTIVPEPWVSGAFNRYTYVHNNPVRFADPTGHQCGAACPPAPAPGVSWQELAKIAGPLAVSVPEAPVAIAATVTAISLSAGAYLGSVWAMQDMGPQGVANPWVSGFPLDEGKELINPTLPFPGTSTVGTGDTSLADAFPLDNVDTTALTLPGRPAATELPNTVPDFSLDPGIELPITLQSSDGTPGSNQAQNKQFRGAVQVIQNILGRTLSKDEIRDLHDAISGMNYGFKEIIEQGIGMFDLGDEEE